jgi:hypothetical protein
LPATPKKASPPMPKSLHQERWLNPGVFGIGFASLLADMGHAIPTALLPSFLVATLGAPAAKLGLIEGIANGAAGIARLLGGALADDPGRRRSVATGGYVGTAVLAALIGVAVTPWQAGVLRVAACCRHAAHSARDYAVIVGLEPRGSNTFGGEPIRSLQCGRSSGQRTRGEGRRSLGCTHGASYRRGVLSLSLPRVRHRAPEHDMVGTVLSRGRRGHRLYWRPLSTPRSHCSSGRAHAHSYRRKHHGVSAVFYSTVSGLLRESCYCSSVFLMTAMA